MAAARSRLFACLAFLLWATVGVLAVEHCACEDVSSACEHAGEACAQPDDCTDCLIPASPSALADEPVALLPSAHVWLGAPLLAPLFAAWYGLQGVWIAIVVIAWAAAFVALALAMGRKEAS